jgi:hypothetical protein
MNIRNAMVLGALWAASLAATAQWQWVDKDGRKVYSDRPPPADVPEKSILKQPGYRGGPAPVPVASPAAASSAAASAAIPRPSGKDRELEEKKKAAEAQEAALKKAEEEKYQKIRAENCARARQAKAGFDSGARIATTSKTGERIILDDEARAAEAKRLQGVIQSECN